MGKGGRPKVRLSHLGMTKLYMWIARYMKIKFIDDKKNKTTRIKSETTSWNAYKKLTNSKHWDGLVRQIYKHHKHKERFINQLTMGNDYEGLTKSHYCNKFYTHIIKRRGKDAFINYIFTKPGEYIHRKKRK